MNIYIRKMSSANFIKNGVFTIEGDILIKGNVFSADLDSRIAGGGELELTDINNRLDGHDSSLNALESSVAFLTSNVEPSQLDSLTELLADYQSADNSLLGVINSNYTTLDNRINTTDVSLYSVENRVGGIENDISSIETTISGLIVTTDALENRVSGTESDISSLNISMGLVETTTNDLVTDLGLLSSKVDGLSADIDYLYTVSGGGGGGGGGGITDITLRTLPRKYMNTLIYTQYHNSNYLSSLTFYDVIGRQGRITPDPTSSKWWTITGSGIYNPGDYWSILSYLDYDISADKNYLINSSVVGQVRFNNGSSPYNAGWQNNNMALYMGKKVFVGSGFYLVDTSGTTHYVDPETNAAFPFEIYKSTNMLRLLDYRDNTTVNVSTTGVLSYADNGKSVCSQQIRVKNQMYLDNKTRSIKFNKIRVCVLFIDGMINLNAQGTGNSLTTWNTYPPELHWGNLQYTGGVSTLGEPVENGGTHSNTYIEVAEIDY